MRTGRRGRAIGVAMTLGVCGWVMTGCGGDTGEDAGPGAGSTGPASSSAAPTDADEETPAEPSEPAEPEALVIERGPVCDVVDEAAVADAFGVARGDVVALYERAPGDEIQTPGGTERATAWSCLFGVKGLPGGADQQASFSLGVEKAPATPASVERALADVEAGLGDGAGAACDRTTEEAWGGATVLTCSRPSRSTQTSYQSGYSQVAYRGVFGDADLRCGVYVGDKPDEELAALAAETLCQDLPARLTG